MAHKRTKKIRLITVILGFLHFILAFGILAYFGISAFVTAEVTSKVVLGLSTGISLILGLISLILDTKHKAGIHRSIMWMLIIGVIHCLESIAPFIWTMAIASILDECIITPAYEHYKTALLANREMDKRGL